MPRRRLLLLVCALAVGSFSAGCGQKGPLYLPQDEKEEERKKEKTSALGARRGSAA